MKTSLIIAILISTLSGSAFSNSLPSKPDNAPPKIDLNHAQTQDLLHKVKGVGAKRAAAIIAYREKQKGFHSLNELAEVPSIGKHFLEKHRAEFEAMFSTEKPY